MKRTELHFQTNMSENRTVISPQDIFEAVKQDGGNAFAVCDTNSVQAFPAIFRLSKEYKNIKAVYGCEIAYRSKYETGIFHMTLLAKNIDGIKALYSIVSNLYDDGEGEAVDYDVIAKNRPNILCGAPGYKSELYRAVNRNSGNAADIVGMYDYLEIYPTHDPHEQGMYAAVFPNLADKASIPLIASCAPNCVEPIDAICRDILQFIDRTTGRSAAWLCKDEMADAFSYFSEDALKPLLYDVPNRIADSIAEMEIFPRDPISFQLEHAEEALSFKCLSRAADIYGKHLPNVVRERLKVEMQMILDHGYASLYVLAMEICDFVRSKKEKLCSRGFVGSSLVAYLLGITEVNPLPAHDYCPNCKHTVFTGSKSQMPFGMKKCPRCFANMYSDGFDIPFEAFIGLNGEKVPEISLCFSEEGRCYAEKYLKMRLGKDRVSLAGQITFFSDKLADSLMEDYKKGISVSEDEHNRIREKLTQTTRQLLPCPGRWLVFPGGYTSGDFTPTVAGKYTHLDYHDLYGVAFEMDILGFDALTLLRFLEKETGVLCEDIDMQSEEIYEAFCNGELDMIPGFSSKFMSEIVRETKPKSFRELIKIYGLCLGVNVWTKNQEPLIKNSCLSLSEAVVFGEDIMTDLIRCHIPREKAYWCMETVRKGGVASGRMSAKEEKELRQFLSSRGELYASICEAIRYLFPKAHAVSYGLLAVRAMWYKLHYPKIYKELYARIVGGGL